MDNNEDGKRNPRRARCEEPDPDHSLRMSSLPEQQPGEGQNLPLPTIMSESEDEDDMDDFEDGDDDDVSDYEYAAEDYEYFSSRGIDGFDSGLLEGEDSNSDFFGTMEEDEIDPDDMSYEELIELGEIIGEEKRGLTTDQMSSFLKPFTYKSVGLKVGTDRCVVCQVEYADGEEVSALSCQHPYHTECIGQWLQIKKTCPICSTEVSSRDTKTIV